MYSIHYIAFLFMYRYNDSSYKHHLTVWLNIAGFLQTTFYKITVLTKNIAQILLIYLRICTRLLGQLLERYLDKKVWNIQEERHFTLSTRANKSLQNNALLKDYLWTRYPPDLFPEEMSCPSISTINSFIQSRDIFVEIIQINHLATKKNRNLLVLQCENFANKQNTSNVKYYLSYAWT